MAPRGSQRRTSDPEREDLKHLDPWLHEGANDNIGVDRFVHSDLDPWLHEGANRLRFRSRFRLFHLDPWLHEGANVVAAVSAAALGSFRSMAPRGSQRAVLPD